MKVEAFLEPTKWSDMQVAARAAEQAGFDSLATPEIKNDPFITMAVVAQATERVDLRTAIAVAFPRSPMMVAVSSWELQENSGGRFMLGLGTQVKGHNERRFSVPWTAPAPRLKEYVESLRAIWRSWQLGERLKYEGKHYSFTLMTPEFAQAPNDLPPIPIYTAAVRPTMMRYAGWIADGVRLHGFCTRRYLEEVALPEIRTGLERAGRPRESFEICGGGFTATGPDEEAVAKAVEWVRYRLSFYGSTRTYAPVFALHGWEELTEKLHAMSKTGKWKEMPAQIPDEVVHEFAAVATWDNLKGAIEERFGGLTDCIELPIPEGTDPAAMAEVIQDIRSIPAVFQGHPTSWGRD